MKTAPPLTYFFMTSRKIEFEKVFCSLSRRLPINYCLTTDDRYSCRNIRNFPQQLEAPLSQKENNFSEFFIAFLKCAWNFEHLEENDEYRCLIFQKIIDPERSGYLNV